MSRLTLTEPTVIEHEWQYIWFDVAHQHSLLLNDSYFYLLSYEEAEPTPKLFFHQEELPQKLILAKVSLDLKIIAVQTSLTTVLVIDTSNKKKWVIEIKNANDNLILNSGIIWSDHGGNSQDLIIATSKGVELYKISQVRGQCKLSRTIQQNVHLFWYETTHRMILLASVQKFAQHFDNKEARKHNEILLMDGYFLKFEKPNIPVIELPAPDKAPRFELGPGISSDNISLVSLYGKLACLVHYTGDGQDYITIYYINKNTVERGHCLSLNCITNILKFSVYDNLLICHSESLKTSFVFDIHSATKKTNLDTRELTESLAKSSPIYITMNVNIINNNGVNSATKASSTKNSNNVNIGDNSYNNLVYGNNSNNNHNDSSGATNTPNNEYDENEWNTIENKNNTNNKLNYNGFQSINIKQFETLSFHGKTSSGSYATTNSNIKATPKKSPRMMNSNSNNNSATNSNSNIRIHVLDLPLAGTELYNLQQYEFYSPNLLYHKTKKIMWRVQGNFQDIIDAIHEPKEQINFLLRRGQYYTQPKHQMSEKLLDYSYISYEGRLAKQLILSQLYKALEKQVSIAYFEEIIVTLIMPYLNEVRRQIRIQQDIENGNVNNLEILSMTNSPNNPNNNNNGININSMLGNNASAATNNNYLITKRKSLAENFMNSSREFYKRASLGASNIIHNGNFGGSSGNSNSIINSSSSNDNNDISNFQLDVEPLEPINHNSSQMYLPDISIIGLRIRSKLAQQKATFALNNQNNSNNSLDNHNNNDTNTLSSLIDRDRQNSSSPTNIRALSFVPAPITTRRDIHGNLITNQNEILSYIWLPLLLLKVDKINISYCCWVLTTFISILREVELHIIPSYSILLLNLLCHNGQVMEVARLMQLGLIPDSSEVALSVLELRDILEDTVSKQLTTIKQEQLQQTQQQQQQMNQRTRTNSDITRVRSGSNNNYDNNNHIINNNVKQRLALEQLELEQQHSAIQTMQQCALDMLWRLDDKITVIKWYLGHAMILEAIGQCTKKLGQWRHGLQPGCISGIEFFTSAIRAIELLDYSHDKFYDIYHVTNETTDNLSYYTVLKNEYRDQLLGKRCDIMYTVYRFISDWDNGVMLHSLKLGKSKLAAQVQFPEFLFDEKSAKKFKELFGFV